MRMGVEEPGQHGTAREVDEDSRGRGLLQERGVVASGHDVTRPNRDGLRHARAAIECDDLAAMEDQIGGRHVTSDSMTALLARQRRAEGRRLHDDRGQYDGAYENAEDNDQNEQGGLDQHGDKHGKQDAKQH
jgi:hypothetical protein